MGRNLSDVIERIFKVLPNDQRGEYLKSSLKEIKDSSDFAPPEMQRFHWQRAAAELEETIGKPEEAWEIAAAEIFSGKR